MTRDLKTFGGIFWSVFRLVRLLAGGWLPNIWIPNDATPIPRCQVAHRTRLVQQRTRLNNRVQATLHRNLIPGCPRSDLFGKSGRLWLNRHALSLLPPHEQAMVTATLRELDLVGAEISGVEHTLAACTLDRPQVRRLLTIPGLDALSADTLIPRRLLPRLHRLGLHEDRGAEGSTLVAA